MAQRHRGQHQERRSYNYRSDRPWRKWWTDSAFVTPSPGHGIFEPPGGRAGTCSAITRNPSFDRQWSLLRRRLGGSCTKTKSKWRPRGSGLSGPRVVLQPPLGFGRAALLVFRKRLYRRFDHVPFRKNQRASQSNNPRNEQDQWSSTGQRFSNHRHLITLAWIVIFDQVDCKLPVSSPPCSCSRPSSGPQTVTHAKNVEENLEPFSIQRQYKQGWYWVSPGLLTRCGHAAARRRDPDSRVSQHLQQGYWRAFRPERLCYGSHPLAEMSNENDRASLRSLSCWVLA